MNRSILEAFERLREFALNILPKPQPLLLLAPLVLTLRKWYFEVLFGVERLKGETIYASVEETASELRTEKMRNHNRSPAAVD